MSSASSLEQPVASTTGIRGSVSATERLQHIGIHAILILGAIIVMIPLAWMISTSLKSPEQINKWPPIWIPNPVVWSNYRSALTIFPVPLWVFLKNSLLMSLGITFGTVLSNSIVAFAFARLRFPGSRVLFLIVLATMMLPGQVTMIPLFLLFSKIGWVNTYNPLVVPAFFGSAYFTFLLRQYYSTIPRELDDAARMDGCSTFGLFWRIILPMSKPALGITAIFAFSWSWNEFLGPLIYLSKLETFPLALALSYLRGTYRVMWSELMVVSFIAMLPPLILFFIAQRSYIQGVVVSGVKG
jgi:ABC-type glycerol-3-phosphate transport system permease component